jgi:L-threonylcarbamoyladenylate synthase
MLGEMRLGKVFVYPTDTIYGIGCDATNPTAVGRIRALKKRDRKPFSVIAPSVEWIMCNCNVGRAEREWLERLPGPYTLIVRLANRAAICPDVNDGIATIGLRIPNNWFAGVVAKAGIPFVTTSVNVTGKPFMTSLSDINPGLREGVDYLVDVGPLKNKPSKVIDLVSGAAVRE